MIDHKILKLVDTLCLNLDINDYIGLIVYGSYVGKRNSNLSDLDVMIIKNNYETQDCGSLMIDNVRVEYFIQDLKRLYELIKIEVGNNDPSHLTKFITCEIIYDNDNKTKEFIDYAKELYNKKINHSFNDEDRFSIFSINNRIEDLYDLLYDNSFYSVYYVTLEKIRLLYSKINGIIDLPMTKIKRVYTDKEYANKYISSSVHKLPNEEFINLYLECLNIDDKNIMIDKLKKLYNYSFKEYGFDPSNFCLKFNDKTPFRV